WAILPTGTDGLRLESAESTTASNACRPKLTVTYVPPAAGCTTPADCNDNNACTTDVCNNGTCEHAPVTCNDSNPCTTDTCNPATGCVFTPMVCDDGNPCTSDACVS